jgi:hypothetical protein
MRLVLKSAQVNEKEIVLEIYALGEQFKTLESVKSGEKVRQTPNWLPESNNRQNFSHGFRDAATSKQTENHQSLQASIS